MNFYLKRRVIVRIISFALVFVLGFLGTVLKYNKTLNDTRRQLVHRYQSAMEDLSSEMQSISLTLGKALYTGTPAGLTVLTNELVLQAGTASAALSSIPTNQNNLQTVSKFLSQVSDYSLNLTKKVVNGGQITAYERETIKKLAAVASDLSQRLDAAKTMYNDEKNWSQNIDAVLSGAQSTTNIDTSFTEVEQSLNQYPTLIYDGPFSDHIANKQSALLKTSKEIDLDTAKQYAVGVAGEKAQNIKSIGSEEGKTPAFVFDFDEKTVAITKKGGYTLYYKNEREISSAQISYEDAVQRAKNYIESLNIGNFETSYYFADEGICVINFAYKQGDIICYTDLIKVGIALDNGEVVFYEARGYIMNHHPRTLSTPSFTATDAKQKLSPNLKVQSINLALIPSGGEYELYCYEFHCIGDGGQEILVYINTKTLAEENLLILLKTDGGVLTK
ncbi:MAG: germination protein YpeB [Clostridia bacterium]|nr:germination protein YpeB [Clostridia bacterium]